MIECLQFETSGRSFCLDVDQVLGLISLPPHMKESPSSIPFNGDDIPVYPLERILELEEKTRMTPPEVIVLKDDKETYGISVDLVGEIHKVPIQRSMFRFPDTRRSRIKMFGVWGMVNLGDKLALILEPLTLLKKMLEKDFFEPPPPPLESNVEDQSRPVF